jgi:hypothetical protein
MTNEERDLIQSFVARIGGAPASGGFASVPSTQPTLPPIDREADAFIAEQFTRYPEARYRVTQLAFIQEHALAEAQNQLARLQAENQALRQHLQQQVQPQQPPASPWGAPAQAQPQPQQRGFFGNLFGGGQQAAPPPPPPQYAPPQPQYPPGYQPGMFPARGSGFLGSALSTAAGVAGGMFAANALMNLFSPGHSAGFGSAFAQPAPFAPMSGSAPPSSPWGSDPAAAYDAGGLSKDATWDNNQSGAWQDGSNQGGGWQDPSNQDSGWQDASSQDSGWQDPGSSDDFV